jgi:hypothetical protein
MQGIRKASSFSAEDNGAMPTDRILALSKDVHIPMPRTCMFRQRRMKFANGFLFW